MLGPSLGGPVFRFFTTLPGILLFYFKKIEPFKPKYAPSKKDKDEITAHEAWDLDPKQGNYPMYYMERRKRYDDRSLINEPIDI